MTQRKKKGKKRSEFSQLPRKNKPEINVQVNTAAAKPAASAPAALPVDMEHSLANVKELFDDGLRNEAMTMLTRLPDSTPDDISLLEELGHKMMGSQEFDTAAILHRRWISVDPNNSRAHNALGVALVSAQWHEPALQPLRQAVVLSPDNPTYQFNLAKLSMVLNKWGEARAMLVSMLNKYPDQKDKIDELLAQFPEDEKII